VEYNGAIERVVTKTYNTEDVPQKHILNAYHLLWRRLARSIWRSVFAILVGVFT